MQLVEHVAVVRIFIFDDGAHPDLWNGELQQVVLAVRLFLEYQVLRQGCLPDLSVLHIVGRGLQVADFLIGEGFKGIIVVGYHHVGIARALWLEDLDANLLMIVHQIISRLNGVFHLGQTAQHNSFSRTVCLIDGHLHLLLGRFAELLVHCLLCHASKCRHDANNNCHYGPVHVTNLLLLSLYAGLSDSHRASSTKHAAKVHHSYDIAKYLDYTYYTKSYLCNVNHQNASKEMEATVRTFTAEDWAEHEKYVQMFRAAKQRKREWQARMEIVLAEKEEKVCKRRAEVDALFF